MTGSGVRGGRVADSRGSPIHDAVAVVDIGKSYGGRPVLRGVSFRVAAGEIVAILGPNGAGKTTTVEIVEGYRRADSGEVRVLGVDPASSGRDHRARVGLMLQGGGGIDPRMTAREVVALHARFHARPRDVDEVLAAVALTGAQTRTRYRRLSGGERQRVALALALVGRPELAILDEPASGLDVEGRALVRALLAELRAQGTAVLLTSHDLADVERVADRIVILDHGRIVATGTSADLIAGTVEAIRFRLARSLSAEDRGSLARSLGAGDVLVEDGGHARYRVAGVAPSPNAVARLAAWCEARGALIVELRTGGGTLEERYLELLAIAEAGAPEKVA